MLGTKNIKYGEIIKASKNPTKSYIFERLRKAEVCHYYSGNILYNVNRT